MLSRSQRRRAENEVVFRKRNEAIRSKAEELLPKELHDEFPLRFICECSDENCRETIQLTAGEYRATRRSDRHFIVMPGHIQGDIEQVVAVHHFLVVRKTEEPPPTDGRLNRTS